MNNNDKTAPPREGKWFAGASSLLLGLYLAAYFLVPYKPWLSPVSFHTPFLAAGLLLYASSLFPLRNGMFDDFTADIALFALFSGLFLISSCAVHFSDFNRAGVQAYLVSFSCLFFVRLAIRRFDSSVIFLLMRIYLVASGALILLQVNFSGLFYVAGFFGQTNFGLGTQGWGFGNTHIWAGGAVSWMLSVLLARYSFAAESKGMREELGSLLAFGAGAVGLYYTLNRGAWLALLAVIVILASALSWEKRPLRYFARALAVMFLSVVFFKTVTHPEIYRMGEKVSSIARLDISHDASSITRLKAWGVALDGIKSSPLWGIGVGQYPKLYEKAFPSLFSGLAPDRYDPNPRQIPHNSYLYYTVEAGVLPSLALLAFMAYIFYRGFRAGPGAAVFPFLIGAAAVCVWMVTCDYINERIFWIALGALAGLGAQKTAAER